MADPVSPESVQTHLGTEDLWRLGAATGCSWRASGSTAVPSDEQDGRALVNVPTCPQSAHVPGVIFLCPLQLNVGGAAQLTSDGLLLIHSGEIRDRDKGFLSQYIHVWAIFTVTMGIIYSLDTMTLIFSCSFLCSYIFYRKKIILSLRQRLYHHA